MARNPFTPTFGTVPAVLAGREQLLADMRRALEARYGDPNLSTIITGARGTGKTALLTYIRSEAETMGWIAVGTTALPGMLEDIFEQTVVRARHLIDRPASHHITSLAAGPVSVGWDNNPPHEGNWRTRMGRILDELSEQNIGLLITVDEVRNDVDELVALAAVYQHFVSEGRSVGLVLAGLPYHVLSLTHDRSVSFLRRCVQYRLGAIPNVDVESSLRITARQAGKEFNRDALMICSDAVQGFAFMLQLVGFRTWIESEGSSVITTEHANEGVAAARSYLETSILASTYRELSPGDIRFLEAMLEDRSESRMSVVAKRMGVSTGYASMYRSRLLAAGVIEEKARGVVAFELPGFRSYVSSRRAEREDEGNLR